jgi:WD40 repeat protein
VAFSPDGKTLAASSGDGMVKIWEVATGKVRAIFKGPPSSPGLSYGSVAFSPDGKTLAAGSDAKGVAAKIWDVATGKELATLEEQATIGEQADELGVVFLLTYSPDGKTIATSRVVRSNTVARDGRRIVKLWDVATGAERPMPKGQGEQAVAFAPDGRTVVVSITEGPRVVWTGKGPGVIPVFDGRNRPPTPVKSGIGMVKLWDPTTGRERATLQGLVYGFRFVAFSPDGKVLATGDEGSAEGLNTSIRLWDTATGRERAILKGHTQPVSSVAFSPDGKTLASAGGRAVWPDAQGRLHTAWIDARGYFNTAHPDKWLEGVGTVKLWDVATGRERATWAVDSAQVYHLAFSPDGKLLSLGDGDGTVRLLDAATGGARGNVEGESGPGPAFSPDCKSLALVGRPPEAEYANRQPVMLWDVAALGKERATLKGVGDELAFSPDGKAISGRGNYLGVWLITVWDAATGRQRLAPGGLWLAISPDRTMLASADQGALGPQKQHYDASFKLWDAATGKERVTLKGHTLTVYPVTFSPDGKTVASASRDGTVRLWDAATGKEQAALAIEAASLDGGLFKQPYLVFSPDGKTLGFIGRDETVTAWDVATRAKKDLPADPKELAKTFLPDDKAATVVTSDGLLTRLNPPISKELAEFISSSAGRRALSPDGKTLAVAGHRGAISLRDAATGKPRATLAGHSAEVCSVVFSPDGKTLATGGNDWAVKLWDLATGKEITTFWGHTAGVTSLVFSPDGKTLASGSRGVVKLWDVPAARAKDK